MIKYSLFSLLLTACIMSAQNNPKMVLAQRYGQNNILDIVTPIQDLQTLILGYLSWEHYITINKNTFPVKSPCGKFYINKAVSGEIGLYDTVTKSSICTLELGNPNAIAYSPYGNFIACHESFERPRGFLKIWDITKSTYTKKIFTPFATYSLSFTYSRCGKLIFIEEKGSLDDKAESVGVVDVLRSCLVDQLKVNKSKAAFDKDISNNFAALENAEGIVEIWYNQAKEIKSADAKLKKLKAKTKIEMIN